jgi:hypothetical protein
VQTIYHSDAFDREVAFAAKLRRRTSRPAVSLPDGRVERRVAVVTEIVLPAAIEGFVGGRVVGFEEVTVFDADGRRGDLRVESAAGRLAQVSGEIRFVEEVRGVRILFQGEAFVAVPGMGRLIARYLVREVQTRYAIAGHVLQRLADEMRLRRAGLAALPA